MESEITQSMCKREEVEHIVDKSTKDIRDDIKDLKREHETWQREIASNIDKRIKEIAVAEIRQDREGLVRYVGWGGIVGVAMAVYFFGGLTNQVENLQITMDELKKEQEEFNRFMNSGDRFTAEDGTNLKKYIDQQDTAIMTSMKEGFSELKLIIRDHQATVGN